MDWSVEEMKSGLGISKRQKQTVRDNVSAELDKLIELINESFEKQHKRQGILTAKHTAEDLVANGVIISSVFSYSGEGV